MENQTLLEWVEKNKQNLKEMSPEQKEKMDLATEQGKAMIPIIFNRGRFKKVD